MMVAAYNVSIQRIEIELSQTLDEIRTLRRRQIYLQKSNAPSDKNKRPDDDSSDDTDVLFDQDTDVIDEFNDLSFEANRILFKTFIKLTIGLNELQRISNSIGILLEPAFGSFFLTIMQCIIGEAAGLVESRILRLTLIFFAWSGLNVIAAVIAQLASRIAQLEPICWSIITEHTTLMRLKHSHLIGQDFTSANLSRLVFSFNHARHLYIPAPFGQTLTYQKVLEQNFLISSLGSIFFTH